MKHLRHIAVIDIGKTNAKLALVDAGGLEEIAVVTRPNTVLAGPPWPHFDLAGHWAFFLHHLAAFHRAHGVDAVSVTTHGAAAVLLDAQGALAAPMLDYEFEIPADSACRYDALRPDFSDTGSPRLAAGLNLGAQLHWLMEQPGLAARTAHVLTYPQYWGWRLTGEMASDVTSLGCHTDLWLPAEGRFSDLVERLGLSGRIAPPRRPGEILGTLRPEIARETGLSPDTPVACGIHDSNASLYPHVAGRRGAFAVVSTGTWVVCMANGGAGVGGAGAGSAAKLDPARDVLVNVNALGQPVPSARFMGGREYEIIRRGSAAVPDAADRRAVLGTGRGTTPPVGAMLLPSVVPGSGPFPDRQMRWIGEPMAAGERGLALSWYLALMTETCLGLTGARGPVIVEGPFARNRQYLEMLAALRPEGVEIATSATGTSVGAALLVLPGGTAPATRRVDVPDDAEALRGYARCFADALKGELETPCDFP